MEINYCCYESKESIQGIFMNKVCIFHNVIENQTFYHWWWWLGFRFLDPFTIYKDQYYVGLWCLLKATKIVEWPFQFWDAKSNCIIKTKLEKFNKSGLEVFVIPTVDVPSNGANWQRVGTFGSSGHVAIEEHELVATWTYPQNKFHQHHL